MTVFALPKINYTTHKQIEQLTKLFKQNLRSNVTNKSVPAILYNKKMSHKLFENNQTGVCIDLSDECENVAYRKWQL
jgi:hypothetical protein